MQILDPRLGPKEETVVALGVFDGVHLGHQELFHEAAAKRDGSGMAMLAMTFVPHPRTLTERPNGYDRLLTPSMERQELFMDLGSDYALSVPFTKELAAKSPREFAERYLAGQCRAKHVVCGFNFTFGHRGLGTPADLTLFGRELGFTVSVVPPFAINGTTVSSTLIRTALATGDIVGATACLGRPYCITGEVATGDGRGKTIGIPTCNISVDEDKLIPGIGVYAAFARVMVQGVKSAPAVLPAVVNVGTRPTFNGQGVRVETHLPGFAGNLYGKTMQVLFLEYLREERRFPDASALRAQVEEDSKRSLAACSKACSFTLPRAYDRMLASELP